jgi:hypothetical protein
MEMGILAVALAQNIGLRKENTIANPIWGVS